MFSNKNALLMVMVSSLTALLFLARQKLARTRADQNLQKKAINTWEGEGGNLPTKPIDPK